MSLLKKNLLTIATFFLLMVISTTMFLLSSDQTEPIYTVAFAASLFCECISLLLFLAINLIREAKPKVKELSKASTTLILYNVLSLSLSLLFPIYLKDGHIPFIIVQAFLLVAVFIAMSIYYSSGKAAVLAEEKATDQVSSLDIIENTLLLMYNNADYSPYSNELRQLCEAFKEIDHSSYTDTDKQIGELVYALHTVLKSNNSAEENKIAELTDKILQMTRQQSPEVIIGT